MTTAEPRAVLQRIYDEAYSGIIQPVWTEEEAHLRGLEAVARASSPSERERALEEALRAISGYCEMEGMTRARMKRIADKALGGQP